MDEDDLTVRILDGLGDIMIDNDTWLPITHSGSTSLATPITIFTLNNLLYVPSMNKNLISISQFYLSNNVSISFLVKDIHIGAILLKGQMIDGVYECLISSLTTSLVFLFSNVKTTSSEWKRNVQFKE
jgi:hypothetical protein